jgi:hypothetical protein
VAETVTIQGQSYLRRNPLGVLGLSFITLGIYFLYWYYKTNDDLRRYQHDDTISPTRSLMAWIFGWLIIVPPFIAMWNTAKHLQDAERQAALAQTVEPALTLVIMVIFGIANGAYMQDHLNRVWDASSGPEALSAGGVPPPLPAPPE